MSFREVFPDSKRHRRELNLGTANRLRPVPTVSVNVSGGTSGDDGWFKFGSGSPVDDVEVTFDVTCEACISQSAACTGTTTISSDTMGDLVSCTATNASGSDN